MKNQKRLATLMGISLFTALMCVSAMLYIPLTVPVTLQTLVLFLAFFILGGRDATLAVALYVAIGALGLPVFSGFTGGIARLLDPTGGYILGMLLGALVYAFFDTGRTKSPKIKLTAAAIALVTVYTAGTLWYALVYSRESSLGAIFLTCVVPFVIPDIVKLGLAYTVAKRIPKP